MGQKNCVKNSKLKTVFHNWADSQSATCMYKKYTITSSTYLLHGYAYCSNIYRYHVISWIIYLFTLIMKQTIAVLGTIGLTAFGVIPPWSDGGIYCDDPSINFKFQGDTVPTLWLFIGLLIPPLLVVSMSIFYISVYEYWVLYHIICIPIYTFSSTIIRLLTIH